MRKKNRKLRWLLPGIVLGAMLLVSGCDLSLLEELLPKDGFNSTDVVQGTVTGIDTFPVVDGNNASFTIADLKSTERAIVAISPWDLATPGEATVFDVQISKTENSPQSVSGKSLSPAALQPGEEVPAGLDAGIRGRIIFGEGASSAVYQSGAKAKGVGISFGEGRELGEAGVGDQDASQDKNATQNNQDTASGDYYTYTGSAGEVSGAKAIFPEENTLPAQLQSTETRTFYVREGSGYKTITASRVKTGQNLCIFLDDSVAGRVTDTQITGIVDQFDRKIYSTVTGNFGTPRDVDGNDKVILLITPLLYKGSTTQLVGYFDERDFHDQSSDNRYTNLADMIYLNASVVVKGDMQPVYGNIAHEFQHLVFFSEKCRAEEAHRYGDRFGDAYSDVWINEGFSMLAAHLTGFINLANDWRVYDSNFGYFARPEADGLMGWDGSRDSSNYGSAGLFAYYLYDHYRSSIKKITTTSETIEKAIELAVGSNPGFAGVFRNWMVANMADRLKNVMNSNYRYNGLTLKSSPAVEKLLNSDSSEIKGMGVKYYIIDGNDADVTIRLTDYFGGTLPDSNVAVILLSNS